jgi:hypothetical protein
VQMAVETVPRGRSAPHGDESTTQQTGGRASYKGMDSPANKIHQCLRVTKKGNEATRTTSVKQATRENRRSALLLAQSFCLTMRDLHTMDADTLTALRLHTRDELSSQLRWIQTRISLATMVGFKN